MVLYCSWVLPISPPTWTSWLKCSPLVANNQTIGFWWNSDLEFNIMSAFDFTILAPSLFCLNIGILKLPADLSSKSGFWPSCWISDIVVQWLLFRQWSRESKNVLDLKLNLTYTILIKLISFKQQYFPQFDFQEKKWKNMSKFVMVTTP